MNYRVLPQSDVKVSAITYGAFAIGGWFWGGSDESEAIQAIETAIDNGVTTIDMVPVYGMGHSETIVGNTIKGKRNKVQILTKFGMVWDKEKGDLAFIAKANLALSVTIIATATLIATIMTLLLMKMLGGTFIPVHFWDMLWDVMKILIIPIFAGIVFHHLFQGKISWLEKVMPRISMLNIALIIVIITAAGRDSLLIVGVALIVAMFLHMTVRFFLGYSVAKLLRLPECSCRSVALEVGMQNGGLASGIAAAMGKIATVGLAAAVNGPLMNTVFLLFPHGGDERK